MAETISYLAVTRPVLNIGYEQMEALTERLYEEPFPGETPPEEVMEGFLKRPNQLRTQVLAKAEFLRMQRRLGADSLDAADVTELEAMVREILDEQPQTYSTGLMPLRLENWGQRPKLKLNAAYSQDVVKERYMVQKALSGFLGTELSQSKGWFGRTKRVTPVELAASRTDEQMVLLSQLKHILEREPLLPSVVTFGAPDVEQSVAYLKD